MAQDEGGKPLNIAYSVAGLASVLVYAVLLIPPPKIGLFWAVGLGLLLAAFYGWAEHQALRSKKGAFSDPGENLTTLLLAPLTVLGVGFVFSNRFGDFVAQWRTFFFAFAIFFGLAGIVRLLLAKADFSQEQLRRRMTQLEEEYRRSVDVNSPESA